jgi:uncharacterized protein YndB with AHSA1/START domain
MTIRTETRASRIRSHEIAKREIGQKLIAAGEARTAILRRAYPTTVENVWTAITERGHLRVWFIEPMGDLRLGGTFTFEGTAHGRVLRCDAPRSLSFTWLYGPGRADEVAVRLSPLGEKRTLLELEHASVADLAPDGITDAIVGVGVGWELAMAYLGRHLRHKLPAPPVGLPGRWFERTPADAKLVRASTRAWTELLAGST